MNTEFQTDTSLRLQEPQIDAGSALMLIVDADRDIRHINPTLSQLLGYYANDLIGQPFPLMRHPDMPAALMREMWAVAEDGQVWMDPIALRCRDGGRLWALATCAPVKHPRLGNSIVMMMMRPSGAQLDAAMERYRWAHNRVSSWLDKLSLEPLGLDHVIAW